MHRFLIVLEPIDRFASQIVPAAAVSWIHSRAQLPSALRMK